MSWRSGAQLFGEFWPLVQAHIAERGRRQEFLRQILALFLQWDVDPENIADLHPEVREALTALGESVDESSKGEDEISSCVQQLSSPAEKDRVAAAQALAFFVHQADDPDKAAEATFRVLINVLQDVSMKVRRAAAKSIDDLLSDGFPLPRKCLNKLRGRPSAEDAIVRKRVASALKRVEKSAKGQPGPSRNSHRV